MHGYKLEAPKVPLPKKKKRKKLSGAGEDKGQDGKNQEDGSD